MALPLGQLVLGVVMLVPVGLEELEVVGRECDSPKKTASSLVRKHGDLHLLRGVRWKRLHVSGDLLGFEGSGVKRRRLTLNEVVFPRVGVG